MSNILNLKCPCDLCSNNPTFCDSMDNCTALKSYIKAKHYKA